MPHRLPSVHLHMFGTQAVMKPVAAFRVPYTIVHSMFVVAGFARLFQLLSAGLQPFYISLFSIASRAFELVASSW